MKRFVVVSIGLLFVTDAWGSGSFGEPPPAPRGELRIVDREPRNWVWMTLQVFSGSLH